jgi:hypothetical protein
MTAPIRPRPAAARPSPPGTPPPGGKPGPGILPAPRQLADLRAPFLGPFLVLIATRIAASWLTRAPAEDAFITFRYARNLASGHGLVYNPGESVMGYSSPLWTVWCAAGHALFGDPIAWSRVSATLADVVALVLVTHLLLRHATRAAAWTFAVFFAAWPYFAFASASGMEMSLLFALISLAAAAAGTIASGPALAALALTRPEGLAAALVISLRARGRDRVVAAALAAAGLGALAWQYGTIVPQSVASKAALYGLGGPWAGRFWWEWLSPALLGRYPGLGDTTMLALLTVVAAPSFYHGVRELWRVRSTRLAIAAAAAVGIWLGYALLGVAYFWWYLFVPLAGVALVAAVGLPQAVRGPLIPVALAALTASLWSVAPSLYVGRAQQEQVAFGGAADALRRSCRPGDRVLLEPIGFVGYYAPVVVIDEIGLVTPRVAERRRRGAGWYFDTIEAERPEWLVVRAGVLRTGDAFAGAGAPFRSGAERDSLLARYSPVTATGPEGEAGTLVLMRRLGP